MITRSNSLRRKVTLAVFSVISASLLIAAAGLGLFEYRAAQNRLESSLQALAQISFTQVVPAVDFGVADAANETLARLESSTLVTAATVLVPRPGDTPVRFASYVQKDRTPGFIGGGRPDGFYRERDRALLVTTFVRDGAPVATLQLEGDLSPTRREFITTLEVLGGVFVVLLFIGWILSRRLERAITRPMLALADTARRVHETNDFRLRAVPETTDEIGQLAVQFNAMLAGIADRDREIAANNAFTRAILAGAGVAVISTDRDGTVRTFNPAAERMLGYEASEVVGRVSPVIWHEPAEMAARAEVSSRQLGRAVASGFEAFVAAISPDGADGREWTYVRKDGRRIPVFLVVSELRGAAGDLIGYVGLATDLTERRQRERALQSFSELTGGVTGEAFFTATVRQLAVELGVRYALIVEVTPRPDGTARAQTLAVWAGGPVADLGYELVGTPCENVLIQGLCHYSDGVAELFPSDLLLRQMGARSYAGVPIRDHTGRTLGLVAVLDDKPMPDVQAASLLLVLSATRSAAEIQRTRSEQQIVRLNAELEARVSDRTTELAARVAEVERLNVEQRDLMRDLRMSQESADRAAARLQEANSSLLTANHELESFSYSVSHDLRAPLRNINGFLELLVARSAGRLDAEGERFVTVVTREATRMGALIDDLLTFSRLGRTEMVVQPVDLEALVVGVREELRSEIGDRPVEWLIDPLPQVRGDPVLLRQVISNLLANALKFTRRCAAPRIEIGASLPSAGERRVTIFVRDNGAGFNPKYLDKLFGVFQRLHNARDFEGTGIGLANVKRIVTRHGGRVWAEGQVDRGATFYFTLAPAEN